MHYHSNRTQTRHRVAVLVSVLGIEPQALHIVFQNGGEGGLHSLRTFPHPTLKQSLALNLLCVAQVNLEL